MRKCFVLVFLCTCLLGAQSPNALTNDSIIKLVQAGVPTETIIRTIAEADKVNFRFIGPELQRLVVDARVPDEVFKAMVAKDKGLPIPGFPVATQTPAVAAQPATNTLSAPHAATSKPKASTQPSRNSSPSCTYFTVVTQDKLNNVKQGLSADDVKWFQKSFAKKYPSVCYAEPAATVPVVFYITVTPDVYHGTRVVSQTSTHSDPVSGTVTEQDGSTSQVSGTVESTTTSSTAVPYSVEYGIYTLSVERRKSDGQFEVVHRFQQKGLYYKLYGIPLGGRGHHPVHAVIDDAAKWLSSGGLTDPKQSAF
jgi:hypothetical protein